MKRTPAVVAAAAAAVVATGVSACTSSDGTTRGKPRPVGSPTAARTGKGNVPVTESRPRPCKGGTYTWFDTQRRWVLNGVTAPQHLTAAKATRYAPVENASGEKTAALPVTLWSSARYT
nr:hypothetical protein OG781_31625 [Streptomyces sp. NBC_00830]